MSAALGLWISRLGPGALESVLEAPEPPQWLGLDLQHGEITWAQTPELIRLAELFDVPVLIRVEDHAAAGVGRALDQGARGVIVPAVESAQEAQQIVAASRYAPLGRRSEGARRPSRLSARHALAGLDAPLVLAMIETGAGLENCTQILETDSLSGVFVGPVDLARSIGADSSDAAPVRAAVTSVAQAAHARGSVVGLFAVRPWPSGAMPDLDLIAAGTDTDLLRRGLAASRAEWDGSA